MKFLTGRVVYSLLFYLLAVILMMVARPSFLFAADGEIKPYGVGEGKTVFSIGVLVVVLAISTFYTFAVLDVVFGK